MEILVVLAALVLAAGYLWRRGASALKPGETSFGCGGCTGCSKPCACPSEHFHECQSAEHRDR